MQSLHIHQLMPNVSTYLFIVSSLILHYKLRWQPLEGKNPLQPHPFLGFP